MKVFCSVLLFIVLDFFLSGVSSAQTNMFPSTGSAGIGTITPNSSSALDIVSTTQGVLVSRMTMTQRNAIVSPATGLLIYQTNNTPGFYYYTGAAWTAVSTKDASKSLNNLVAPTAVNVTMQPNGDNTIDLGSSAFSWKDLYVDGVGYLSTAKLDNYTGTPQAGMIRWNDPEFEGFDGTKWRGFLFADVYTAGS